MPKREKQDAELLKKRIQDHIDVLEFLLKPKTLRSFGTGEQRSPPKLTIYFAGYIAMRRIYEIKEREGESFGDSELDKPKSDPTSIIYRIEKEVAHPLGYETSTLFKIKKFKYWGEKFLRCCTRYT